MKATIDKHRREIQFQVGDRVLGKLQPYCQSSVHWGVNKKLLVRLYGPYKVTAKIGAVTYRLELPPDSKVHLVFHMSLLRRVSGQHPIEAEFPLDVEVEESSFEPKEILLSHWGWQGQKRGFNLLVQWLGRPMEEASWLSEDDLRA